MSARFDRTAPDGGVKAMLRLETGRVYFEWQFFYTEPPRQELISIRLRDRRQETVLECIGLAAEEEPLRAILRQPHLWKGSRDPYLYTLEAVLADEGGDCIDRISSFIPLRSVEWREGRGFLLNGAPFELRTVEYAVPTQMSDAVCQGLVMDDMRRLLCLGANSIYIERGKGLTQPFLQLCDRLGLLVLTELSYLRNVNDFGRIRRLPVLRGKGEGTVLEQGGRLTAEFYRLRAAWSPEPFVHIVPESVIRQKNGSFCVTVYSSCHRIALYSDGELFEFMSGQGEFVFREVPARGPCVMLTAEGDGCSEAFSCHKLLRKKTTDG